MATSKYPVQIVTDAGYQVRASANRCKPFFGLLEWENWADEGHSSVTVQGVRLFVMSKKDAAMYNANRPHRLMAGCPDCGKVVSYGRLHQHMASHE